MGNDYAGLIRRQHEFLAGGVTRSIQFRRDMLDALADAIRANEAAITAALKKDLGKSAEEAYATEIGILYAEIRHNRRRLAAWAKTRRVRTPLYQAVSRCYVRPTPLGACLVVAPWNYPFQLAMAPLVAAVAAGNAVVLKPSELAPATAAVLAEMINGTFSDDYITCVQGDAAATEALIDAKPDLVFFTGSTAVGSLVMRRAAEHLIPVALELGGKSPCLVLADANLRQAARKIAWAKFVNCGQTCVAPDYLLVDQSVRGPFLAELRRAVAEFYAPGVDPDDADALNRALRASPDYGRIVNERHFRRLESYLEGASVLFGGDRDAGSRYFGPTVLDAPGADSPVMRDEIFGPILPVFAFDDLDACLAQLAEKPRPLAFYVFSADRRRARRIVDGQHCGGACVNDAIVHVAVPDLPFGGVGASGMGRYHGKAGFDAFSYQKSVVDHAIFPHFRFRYPPLSGKLPLFRRFL